MLHNTNAIHIDTLIVHRFMRNCHDEIKVKDTLLYNNIFRCTEKAQSSFIEIRTKRKQNL